MDNDNNTSPASTPARFAPAGETPILGYSGNGEVSSAQRESDELQMLVNSNLATELDREFHTYTTDRVKMADTDAAFKWLDDFSVRRFGVRGERGLGWLKADDSGQTHEFRSPDEYATFLSDILVNGNSAIEDDAERDWRLAGSDRDARIKAYEKYHPHALDPISLLNASENVSLAPGLNISFNRKRLSDEEIDEKLDAYDAEISARRFGRLVETFGDDFTEREKDMAFSALKSQGRGVADEYKADFNQLLATDTEKAARIAYLARVAKLHHPGELDFLRRFRDMGYAFAQGAEDLARGIDSATKEGRETLSVLTDYIDQAPPETYWNDEEKAEFARRMDNMRAAAVIRADLLQSRNLGSLASNPLATPAGTKDEATIRREIDFMAARRLQREFTSIDDRRKQLNDRNLLDDAFRASVHPDHGFWWQGMIGAVATVPYMATAAVPYAGMAAVAVSHFGQIEDEIVAAGGDPDEARGIRWALAAGWAAIERMQFGKIAKPIPAILKKQALCGIINNMSKETLVKFGKTLAQGSLELAAKTFDECVEEGLQGNIEGFERSYFAHDASVPSDFKESIKAGLKQGASDFWEAVPTMTILGGVGSAASFAAVRHRAHDAESLHLFAQKQMQIARSLSGGVTDFRTAEQAAGVRDTLNDMHAIWDKHTSPAEAADEIRAKYLLSDRELSDIVDYMELRASMLDSAMWSESDAEAAAVHAFVGPKLTIGARGAHYDPDLFFVNVLGAAKSSSQGTTKYTLKNGWSVTLDENDTAPDTSSLGWWQSLKSAMEQSGQNLKDGATISLAEFKTLSPEEKLGYIPTFEQYTKGMNESERNILNGPAGYNLYTAANFRILDADGKERLGADGVIEIKNAYRDFVRKGGNFELAHEYSHFVSAMVRDSLDENTVKTLQSIFGKPTSSNELWNEEVAGDAFAQYLRGKYDFRRLTREERRAAMNWFERLLDTIKNLFSLTGETAPAAPVELSKVEQARDDAFNALMSGDFQGLSKYAGVEFTEQQTQQQAQNAAQSNAEAPQATVEQNQANHTPQPEPAPEAPTEAPQPQAASPTGIAPTQAAPAPAPEVSIPDSPIKRTGVSMSVLAPDNRSTINTELAWVPLADLVQANPRDDNAPQTPTSPRPLDSLYPTADALSGSPIIAGGMSLIAQGDLIPQLQALAEDGNFDDYLKAIYAQADAHGLEHAPDSMPFPVLVRRVTSATNQTALDNFQKAYDEHIKPFQPKPLAKGTASLPQPGTKGIDAYKVNSEGNTVKDNNGRPIIRHLPAGAWNLLKPPVTTDGRFTRSAQDRAGRGLGIWKPSKTRHNNIFPHFQGNKTLMADRTTQAIQKNFTLPERQHFDSLVDYFGGGGCWGLYHALESFPNVKQIFINEFDPDRLGKIRLLHELGAQVADIARSVFDRFGQPLLDACVVRDGSHESSSPSNIARVIREQFFSQVTDPTERAAVQAFLDCASTMLASQGDTTRQGIDRALAVLASDGKKAKAAADEFKRRPGASISYIQGDAESNSNSLPHGDTVVTVVDPPYYLTQDYSTDPITGRKRNVTLGLNRVSDNWSYEATFDFLSSLANKGDAIIYTDEAWWFKDTYKSAIDENDVENPEDLPAALDSLADDAVFKAENAILLSIMNLLDHFDVAGKVDNRQEVLGIHHPHTPTVSSAPYRSEAANALAVAKEVNLFDPENPTAYLDGMSASQRKKALSVQRFLDLHAGQYPVLEFWLDNGRALFPSISKNDPIYDAIDLLSPSDKLLLTGWSKKGNGDSSLVLRSFLNRYGGDVSPNQEMNHHPEDLIDDFFEQYNAYKEWKASGGLTHDALDEIDAYKQFIAAGGTREQYFRQRAQALGDISDEAAQYEELANRADDELASAIDHYSNPDARYSIARTFSDPVEDTENIRFCVQADLKPDGVLFNTAKKFWNDGLAKIVNDAKSPDEVQNALKLAGDAIADKYMNRPARISPSRIQQDVMRVQAQTPDQMRQITRQLDIPFRRDAAEYTPDELKRMAAPVAEELTKKRKEIGGQWEEALKDYSPATRYLVLRALYKFISKESEAYPVGYLKAPFDKTMEDFRNAGNPASFNFYSAYNDNIINYIGEDKDAVVEVEPKNGIAGTWVKMPKASESKDEAATRQKVAAASNNTAWCTRYPDSPGTGALKVIKEDDHDFYVFFPKNTTEAALAIVPVKQGEETQLQTNPWYTGIFKRSNGSDNAIEPEYYDSVNELAKKTKDPDLAFTLEKMGYSGLSKEELKELQRQKNKRQIEWMQGRERITPEDFDDVSRLFNIVLTSNGDEIHLHEYNTGIYEQVEESIRDDFWRIAFNSITHIDGNASIPENASAPALTTIGGNAVINENVNLPALTTIGGRAYIEEGASLPALTSIGGDAGIYENASAPALTTIGGFADIRKGANLPALTSIGGDAVISPNASLTALTTIGGYAVIDDGASLPALTTIGGYASIDDSASVPALETVNGRPYLPNRGQQRFSISAAKPMTAAEINRAVEMFGTTTDPKNVAYITPDGKWLDYDEMGEHYEIRQALSQKRNAQLDALQIDEGDATPYVASALKGGLVRVLGGIYTLEGRPTELGVQIAGRPDAKTLDNIEQFFDAVTKQYPDTERLIVDVEDDNGNAWTRIYTPDETTRLMRDLKSFAKTGEVPPEPSPVALFHTRYSVDTVNPNLREDVQKALAKRTPNEPDTLQIGRHDEVQFATGLAFLDFIGIANHRIVSDATHIRKFASKHHLTPDQIADLVNRCADPVAAMIDGDKCILLTDMLALTDHGETKPVRVLLSPKKWRNGEVVFIATALAENASDEKKYYEPHIKSGLVYCNQNKIAGLGLEEETESILRTQASGDNVKSAEDFSSWTSAHSLPQTDAPRQGGISRARHQASRRHSITAGNSRPNTEAIARAFLAARILAGKDIALADVRRTLAQIGSKENPAQFLERTRAFAERNRSKTRSLVEGASPNLVSKLSELAMGDQLASALDNAISSGAALADPNQGRLLQKAIQSKQSRDLMFAHGFTAAQMMAELPIDLSKALLAIAEYAKDPAYTARLAQQRADREAEREAEREALAREAAELGITVEELQEQRMADEDNAPPAPLKDPSPDELDALNSLLDRAREANARRQVKEAEQKAQRAAEAAQNKTDADADTDDAQDQDSDSPSGDSSPTGSAPTSQDDLDIRRVIPVFESPDVFAQFIIEWTTDRVIEKHPDLPTTDKLWTSPVAIRELKQTASHILRRLAKDTLGSPSINHARNFIDHAINELESDAEIKTFNAVRRRISRIYDQLHDSALKFNRRKAVNNLIAQIKKLTGAKGRASATLEESKRTIDAKTEMWARSLIPLLTMSEEKLQQYIAERQAIITPTENSDEASDANPLSFATYTQDRIIKAQDELALAQKYGGMINWLPGRIADAATEILEQVNGKRQAFEERRAAIDEENAAIRNAIIDAINNGAADKYRKSNAFGRRIGRYTDAMTGNLTLEMQNLIRFCKDPELRRKALLAIEQLSTWIGQGTEKYLLTLAQAQTELHQGLAAIYGSSEAGIKHLLSEEIPTDAALAIFNQDRNRIPTYGRLLQLYATTIQGDYKDNAEKHGRAQQLKLMEQTLTDQDRAFHAWAVNWYAHNRKALSDAVEAVTGLPVTTPDPLYTPARMLSEPDGFATEATAWSPVPSALNRRVKHGLDFNEAINFLSMLQEQAEIRAQTIGFAGLGIRMRDILAHHDLQAVARKHVGKRDISTVLQHVKDTLIQGAARKDETAFYATLNTARRWMARFNLSLNLPSAMKQLASMPVWANAMLGGKEVGLKRTLHYLTTVATKEGRDAISDLMKSDGFKARYLMGWSEETRNILSDPSRNKTINTIARVYDKGMAVNKFFDAVSCLWMAQGFYRDARQHFIDQGHDPEQAKQAALSLTWSVCENGQQSGRVENMNSVQRKGGAIAASIFQYKTAYLLQNAYLFQAIKEMRAGTPGAKGRFMRAAFINCVWIPAFVAVINAAWQALMGDEPPDEDPDKIPDWFKQAAWNMVDGVSAPMFGVSSALHTIYEALTDTHSWHTEGSIPALDNLIKVSRHGATIVYDLGRGVCEEVTALDLEEEITTEKLKEDVDKLLRDLAAPYRHTTDAIKNWSEK